MENFESQIAEKIKRLQQVVIEKTSTLDDSTRAKVYSKFQSIKYKILDGNTFVSKLGVKDSTAFFHPVDNTIYFMDYGQTEVQDVMILHEMLHAISTSQHEKVNNADNYVSGFRYTKALKRNDSLMLSFRNRGINEGATQFFAENFLNIQGTNVYPFEVHIFSILCDECGMGKLKNAYFANGIETVKNVIKDGFKLKSDKLVDDLFAYMDIFGVVFNKSSKYFKNLPIMKNCYNTLLKMKINKLMAEDGYKHSQEEIVKNFSVKNYLSKNQNMILSNFFYSFFIDMERNKLDHLCDEKVSLLPEYKQSFGVDFVAKISELFADGVLSQDFDFLENHLKHLWDNKLGILKNLCSENTYCQKAENEFQYKTISNSFLIDIFLGYLHNENDKIDLSDFSKDEKYQFISLALYNNYDNQSHRYKHFYPKDLVEFINNGLYDCDAFFDTKAMEYIWPAIDKVSPKLFVVNEFKHSYDIVKESMEESQKQELNNI